LFKVNAIKNLPVVKTFFYYYLVKVGIVINLTFYNIGGGGTRRVPPGKRES